MRQIARSTLLALWLAALAGIAHAADKAPAKAPPKPEAAPESIKLTCRVVSIHGDGSQIAFLRRIEVSPASRTFVQYDNHGSGYHLVGRGIVAKLNDKQVVLRDDKVITWVVGRDGSYSLKNNLTGSIQSGECRTG